MDRLAVWVVDVGSVKRRRFGYCGVDRQGRVRDQGTNIVELVRGVVGDLLARWRVALGFECPLYVPIADADKPVELTRARLIDGNRPWSAGAGCGALATGLVECAWILRAVRNATRGKVTATLEFDALCSGTANLLLWEAFISGDAKHGNRRGQNVHIQDARQAAQEFLRRINGHSTLQVDGKESVLSLAGAALLYAGLTKAPAVLHQPCLVVKP